MPDDTHPREAPSDFEDLELGISGDGEGPHRRRSRSAAWLWAILAVLLVAAGSWWWFVGRSRSPSGQATAPPEATLPAPPPATGPQQPPAPLPDLDQSDALVRELVRQLSARPGLAAWLVGDDLVRRFVVVVDNVAEGVSPRSHLPSLAPRSGFQVARPNGRIVIDPASYHRYDDVADTFAAIDPAGAAAAYRRLKPLLQQAYRQLGYPDRDFDDTLRRAMARVLRTPIVAGPVELEPGVSSYRFADPDLESLSPAQKHLLRMGPDNLRKVQGEVLRLAAALGIPAGELPRIES